MNNDPAERAAERILKQSYGYMSELKKDNNMRAAEMADIIRSEYSELMPGGIEVEVPTMAEAVEAEADRVGDALTVKLGLPSGEGTESGDVVDCLESAIRQWRDAAVEAVREEFRALNTTGALDRRVNEARLEEAKWWYKHTEGGGVPTYERIAELKAALGEPK